MTSMRKSVSELIVTGAQPERDINKEILVTGCKFALVSTLSVTRILDEYLQSSL